MTAEAAPAGGGAARHRRAVVEWIVLVAVALAVAFLARQFVFQLFYIPSESMVPALEVNDQVFVNKLAYDLGDPARGDLVVFERPEDWNVEVADLVKRVVGLPGESIEGRDGHVYIDGRRLDEPYLTDGVTTGDFGPTRIRAGHYFMMGDNREHSNDSRAYSAVDEDQFVGKVVMTVWPLDRLSVPGVLLIGLAAVVVIGVAVWILWGRRRR
jgi:signal peptidase I